MITGTIGNGHSREDGSSNEGLIRLIDMVTERTGIVFPEHKHREIRLKLAPLMEQLDEVDIAALTQKVSESESLLQDCINLLTIGESYFFRNRPHFSALAHRIIPDLVEQNSSSKTLRIWCAGCSTGEEPYSISILMRETIRNYEQWKISITATDINTAFLDRAKQAVYSAWSFRGVDEIIKRRYFTMSDDNRYHLRREIADTVDFKSFNLAKTPFLGRISPTMFDLVVCRNVLIYFSYDFANEVVEALNEVVLPEGYLVVGHAESFPALRQLEAIYSDATYYYRKPPPGKRARESVHPVYTVSIPGIAVHDVEKKPVLKKSRSVPPPFGPTKTLETSFEEADDISEFESDLEKAKEYTELGQLKEAKTILARLLVGPGQLDHRAHFLLALVADQEHRIADAISSLRQAIFLNKQFTIGHYYQGVIYEREGDRKSAVRCFNNVLETAYGLPDNFEFEEGGGMTIRTLVDITKERIKELGLT